MCEAEAAAVKEVEVVVGVVGGFFLLPISSTHLVVNLTNGSESQIIVRRLTCREAIVQLRDNVLSFTDSLFSLFWLIAALGDQKLISIGVLTVTLLHLLTQSLIIFLQQHTNTALYKTSAITSTSSGLCMHFGQKQSPEAHLVMSFVHNVWRSGVKSSIILM